MDQPTQIRFPAGTRKKLKKISQKSGVKQADIIRLSLEELFSRYTTPSALFTAYMEARRPEGAE